MKAIPLREQGKLNELVIELDSRAEEVRNAICALNETLAGPRRDLEGAIWEHNIAAQALKDFLHDLARAADEHRAERSQRWLESPAGEAYTVWAESLTETCRQHLRDR